jgi:hypothetical protein
MLAVTRASSSDDDRDCCASWVVRAFPVQPLTLFPISHPYRVMAGFYISLAG